MDAYLDVVDFLLQFAKVSEVELREVEIFLSNGGSVWRATPRGLEQRVGETLQGVVESTIATETRPAHHLSEAWHKAWGRNPDASGAYREAVRAAEASYGPIVSPKNDRATLGTIIADVRNKPSKFRVRLQTDDPEENVDRLVGMLQMLWKSQLDRHGTSDEDVPLNVSLEEARDAVVLATTLVHLAEQGGFTV